MWYNISGLTEFDKKLRLLLFNEIEKIEISVRCAIVNFGTEMTGNSFWMTDANNFSNPSKFNRSIRLIEDELNHTKEDFINHFKETYTNQYPPSWMPTEILPFGVITNIYSNIKNKKIKKRIAQSFTPIRDKIAISCMLRQIPEFSSHAIRHGLYIKNRKRFFCP